MSTIGAVAIWGPMTPASAAEVSIPSVRGVPTVVRLTRRGRVLRALVLLAVVLNLVVLGLAQLTGAPARAGAGPTAPVVGTQVTVDYGDSLWSIAVRIAPNADPRDVVHQLRELNGLSSNLIQPGQVLLVPSGL
jgi:nucleoid-associated protein YgaU